MINEANSQMATMIARAVESDALISRLRERVAELEAESIRYREANDSLSKSLSNALTRCPSERERLLMQALRWAMGSSAMAVEDGTGVVYDIESGDEVQPPAHLAPLIAEAVESKT